jgi:multidrug efflux pump subunit AcrB
MAGTPDVADVSSDLANSSPRIDIAVNRQAAAWYGLTEAGIGQTVAAAFHGASLGQITVDGASQTVVLRFGLAPGSIDQIKALPLPTPTGVVRLDTVAAVSQVDGPVQVSRIGGNRSATVTGTATSDNGGRRRLRPILMTAVATIFALLPMALGLTGSGGFISKPLAVVVIGGLLSSTVLTLVLVPTLYTMVEDRRERRRLRKAGTVELPAEPVDEPEPVGAAVT